MIKIIALFMILISNVLALGETTSIEKVKSKFSLSSYSLDKKIVENLNMIEIIEESNFNNPEDFKRVKAAIRVIQVIEGSLYNYIQKHESTVSQKVKDALIYDVID